MAYSQPKFLFWEYKYIWLMTWTLFWKCLGSDKLKDTYIYMYMYICKQIHVKLIEYKSLW